MAESIALFLFGLALGIGIMSFLVVRAALKDIRNLQS